MVMAALIQRSESCQSGKTSFLQLTEDEWPRYISSIDEDCSDEAKHMFVEFRTSIVEGVQWTDIQDQLVRDAVLSGEDNERITKKCNYDTNADAMRLLLEKLPRHGQRAAYSFVYGLSRKGNKSLAVKLANELGTHKDITQFVERALTVSQPKATVSIKMRIEDQTPEQTSGECTYLNFAEIQNTQEQAIASDSNQRLMRKLQNSIQIALKSLPDFSNLSDEQAKVFNIIEDRQRAIICVKTLSQVLVFRVNCPTFEALRDLECICKNEDLPRKIADAFLEHEDSLEDINLSLTLTKMDIELCERRLMYTDNDLSISEWELQLYHDLEVPVKIPVKVETHLYKGDGDQITSNVRKVLESPEMDTEQNPFQNLDHNITEIILKGLEEYRLKGDNPTELKRIFDIYQMFEKSKREIYGYDGGFLIGCPDRNSAQELVEMTSSKEFQRQFNEAIEAETQKPVELELKTDEAAIDVTMKVLEETASMDADQKCSYEKDMRKERTKLILESLPLQVLTPLQDMQVKENKKVILRCKLSRTNQHVTWYMDGQELFPSDGKYVMMERQGMYELKISKVLPADSGTYRLMCKDYDDGESLPIYTSCELSVHVTMLKRLQDKEVLEGGSVSFVCQTSSEIPASKIYWEKDGCPLSEDSNRRFNVEGNKYRIHLNDVKASDEGDYLCRITINPKANVYQISQAHLTVKNRKAAAPTKEISVYQLAESHIKLEVYEGDIVKEDVDCVVNAVSTTFGYTGGVSDAIRKAAGPELNTFTQTFLEKHGNLKIGQVIMSPGYNMPAKNLLHANGPHVTTAGAPEKLFEVCFKVLQLADEEDFKTMAIPAVSTGKGGLKKEDFGLAIIKALRDFSSKYTATSLQVVKLVDQDPETVKTLKKVADGVLMDFHKGHSFGASGITTETTEGSKSISRGRSQQEKKGDSGCTVC